MVKIFKRSRKISIENMMKNQRKGFTLIEILIVVAIIAILASVVLVGLGPTQQAGRDARRLSDLSEVQNGLELYYNKCGLYPGATAGSPAGCAAVTLGGTGATAYTAMASALKSSGIGISSVPVDPSNNGSQVYSYAVNSTVQTSYVLQTVLENPNNSVFGTYTAPSDYTTDETPEELACTASSTICVSL